MAALAAGSPAVALEVECCQAGMQKLMDLRCKLNLVDIGFGFIAEGSLLESIGGRNGGTEESAVNTAFYVGN
ncbi:hypothetical protein PR202_gb03475 [Eleusine coracana subsp. coracana]|uniref:Uncharacterized protein n=1 Tax=Eleusine coracana subsp. coracana TaxID=191504 RepID=A0AAV5E1W9_ELECO|nr:hypothetical protein PR202_gb03475 [Eleusine coracana subsp. coracana]